MRAGVLMPINEPRAVGLLSAGPALDAPDTAPRSEGPRVAIAGWAALTIFGDHASGWDGLVGGSRINDHTRATWFGRDDRASRLAHGVALQLYGAGIDRDAAVVVGTSKGTVEEWLGPPPPTTSDNSRRGVRAEGLADLAADLGLWLGGRGPRLTVSAACASGLHALIRGAMMIRSGEARQALVVAAEASVHPLFLGSFQRLGVLARPGEGCRPFDRNRTGFYMSEAGAAVLLEAVEPDGSVLSQDAPERKPRRQQAPVYLENFALGGDATHLTGGDPDARVLKHLLRRVIDGRPVDLVHAHGTGTQMNDASELAAIDATVIDQSDPPVVYSHKAALGHSLGASGLLSVVINCMAHTAGEIPPNVRTTHPLPTRRVVIPRAATRRPVRRSVAIAAGFGGPVAVVSLVSH